ncbi:hypothetical protein BLX87_00990, partial [Bacillus sp. VT-16-64]
MARQLKENEIWDLFKHQLRERRVLFLHIDEMQHVMRGNGPTAIQHVADAIKSLTQIEGWPLHLILSGVPALGMFLFGEDQMRNRKSILNFREIVYPDNVALMSFASAGKLEPGIQININRFLARIRQLRKFTYNFSIAFAPDSNLNAGPAIDSVNLYGLPFQLSQAAQKHSGVGLALDVGGQWAQPVTGKIKFLFAGQLHRSQYVDGAFNDMTLSTSAGPRIVLRRWDVSLQGFAARRWYGGAVYSD